MVSGARQRVIPGPGQESVWDYPRPPQVEPVPERVTVTVDGEVVIDTTDAVRVLETSHPPVYYVPRSAAAAGVLRPSERTSYCEFKGQARYLHVCGQLDAAWTYPLPARGYEQLRDMVAVYPSRVEEVTVGGEIATAQDGDFYGGWITARVVGPFKGGAGTMGW